MAEEVYMDIPSVEAIKKKFEAAKSVVRTVIRLLRMLSATLTASAFVTLGGTAAARVLLDRVITNLNQFDQLLDRGIQGVEGAILAYRDADYSGSQMFV